MDRVKLRTKRGFTLWAFKGDSITKEVKKYGEYDSNTLSSIEDILQLISPKLSLDIGANIGNHSLVISKFSGKLICFEPVQFIYELLSLNIKENNISNVVAFNLGLSDKAIQTEIFIPKNGNLGTSSITEKNGDGELLNIKTVKGDEFLTANGFMESVDFIKIDVEGHEAEAIEGLVKTIKKYQPLVLMEWKTPRTINMFEQRKLLSSIFSGYKFYSLTSLQNKKAHPKNFSGFLLRIYHKLFNRGWCLRSFDPSQKYSNIFLVPKRYKKTFYNLKPCN